MWMSLVWVNSCYHDVVCLTDFFVFVCFQKTCEMITLQPNFPPSVSVRPIRDVTLPKVFFHFFHVKGFYEAVSLNTFEGERADCHINKHMKNNCWSNVCSLFQYLKCMKKCIHNVQVCSWWCIKINDAQTPFLFFLT